MKKYDIDGLNQLYETAQRVDDEVFTEMRSNLLLVSGKHYTKRTSKFFDRLRNTNRLSEVQKLRITKNHIHKICRHYVNSILDKVPGVAIAPYNEMEMQDRKAAELNQAVWNDAKEQYRLRERVREWGNNFVEVGEVCVKLFYDPNVGDFVGYAPKMSDEGEYETDDMGEYVGDEGMPIFSGKFVFETVHGFNLLRSPFAKNMKDSPYHIIRKMVDKRFLKKVYATQPEKLEAIEESEKETYVVFDSHKSNYTSTDKEILVREYYFKPCMDYPEGYFYIATEFGILEEGTLPEGVYPLVWAGFDEYASTPRASSIIKVARPYQAELNRAASQQASHQISVGDDKVIYQAGTKLAPGALLPGVRGLTYQGSAPQILPGRDGGQFLPYIQQQISEMYQACMISEIQAEENLGQMDPHTLLFRSASQSQKFSQYTEKFETFLKELCETYLKLAKAYMPDNMFIKAVGKSEAINIAEFKSTEPINYQIKVEPQSESVDSKLGRQMALTHVLQYVGKQLTPKDIGMVLTNMPYVNNEKIFKDLTIDTENVDNDMLALERGEVPTVNPYSDNEYYDKRLTHRMKQADFKMLPPEVQQSYQKLLNMHRMEIQKKQQAAIDAKNDYVPVGGAMITCSMHIPDPERPGKTKQLRLPYQSLDWLVKLLDKQGATLEKLDEMNPGSIAQMQAMGQRGRPQGGPPVVPPGMGGGPEAMNRQVLPPPTM